MAAASLKRRWSLIHSDVLTALRGMADQSMDAALTDVPYGLGTKEPTVDELIAYMRGAELDTGGDFMGRDWSVPSVAVWREMFRVMRPGAHVLVYASSRTWDIISLGLRAAGFENRDTIANFHDQNDTSPPALAWVHAKGFPKSHNVSRAIDEQLGAIRPVVAIDRRTNEPSGLVGAGQGSRTVVDREVTEAATAEAAQFSGHGTALKPAWETILIFRKPLEGTYAENALKYGTGALDIDACRIGYASEADQAAAAAAQRACRDQNEGRTAYGRFEHGAESLPAYFDKQHLGRWPANVAFDEAAGALLDSQSGNRRSGIAVTRNGGGGKVFNGIGQTGIRGYEGRGRPDAGYSDSGGASRYFFCPKVSTRERELGCEDLPLHTAGEMTDRDEDEVALDSPRSGAGRGGGARNNHVCLKPIDLTTYLAKLPLPPARADGLPRKILVTYAGSDSEVIGAIRAGWDHVTAIERDANYCRIFRARVERWGQMPAHLNASAAETPSNDSQVSLFTKGAA